MHYEHNGSAMTAQEDFYHADLGSLGFLLIISLIAGFAELIGRLKIACVSRQLRP